MSRVIYGNHKVFLETDDGQQFFYEENRPPLGAGAMGTVYKGQDYRTGETVAIKRVKDKFANIRSIRDRAKQEASLMFRHRNLVEMIGYCEEDPRGGAIFIISKYVQGDTLDQFVKTRLSSFPDAYKKICEMCFPVFDALAYIHSKGIVHADIKPSNIMVERGNNVRLMDLGISQVHDSFGSQASSGMMGTPRYAAPEQFSGGNGSFRLDGRTDLYEMGVTIYELLAQRNPYDGADLAEIKQKHNSMTLPYLDNVPNAVVDVLRKATNPNPSLRYSNALQFRSELQQAILRPAPKPVWPWILGVAVGVLCLVAIILLIVNQG